MRALVTVFVTCALQAAVMAHALPLLEHHLAIPTLVDPYRLDVRPDGRIAAITREGISIFSSNGVPIMLPDTEIPPLPISVAWSNGFLYVGSEVGRRVDRISPSGQRISSLGVGTGEFERPGDIAVDSAGRVYVLDLLRRDVSVFDSEGTLTSRFGSATLVHPTGLAVDEETGDVYVSDLRMSGVSPSRVCVFSFDGVSGLWNLTREMTGKTGMLGGGKLQLPEGLATDSSSVFVADAFLGQIAVFTKSGSFSGYLGSFGTDTGALRLLSDVAFGPAGRLLVADRGNQRVESFLMDGAVALQVAPSEYHAVLSEGALPVMFSVQVSGAGIGWTVEWDTAWISVTTLAGIGDGTLSVSADPGMLSPGIHRGRISIIDSLGVTTDILVVLELTPVPPRVQAIPSALQFLQRVGGPIAEPGRVLLGAVGPGIGWEASVDAPWLSSNPVSGMSPAELWITLSSAVPTMAPGTYAAQVTIRTPSISSKAIEIPVELKVIEAGSITVTSNLEAARFRGDGAGSFRGGGLSSTLEDLPPGEYVVRFDPVEGYRTPNAETVSVRTGEETRVHGQYVSALPLATHLVSVPSHRRFLELLDLRSGAVERLRSGRVRRISRLAVGDITGDGVDEIVVVGTSPGIAEIFSFAGESLGIIRPRGPYTFKLPAVVDVDGDGIGNLLMITQGSNERREGSRWYVFLVNTHDGEISLEAGPFRSQDVANINAHALDSNADGVEELILTDGDRVVQLDLSAVSPDLVPVEGVCPSLEVHESDVNGDGMRDSLVGCAVGNSEAWPWEAIVAPAAQGGAMDVIRVVPVLTPHGFGTGSFPDSSLCADIDGDGNVEWINLFAAEGTPETRVSVGNGVGPPREYFIQQRHKGDPYSLGKFK